MGTDVRAHPSCSCHGCLAINLTTNKVLRVNGMALGHGERVCESVNVELTGVVEINNEQQFRILDARFLSLDLWMLFF
jgi:hypothetical protein